jgi:rifampicin phosphotransferase
MTALVPFFVTSAGRTLGKTPIIDWSGSVRAANTSQPPGRCRDQSDLASFRPLVVDLADPRAVDVALVGAKAANLARCASAGLPVLPGVVVTTVATDRWAPGEVPPALVLDELRAASGALTGPQVGPLVVRSSSTSEDAERSSMAGRFQSVLDVAGWDGVVEAVRTVRDSAVLDGAQGDSVHPIAVLVQPQLSARHGGVLFGADPVDGDARHLVVEIVAGNPSTLIGGQATARHLVLSRRGRCISSAGDGPSPGRRERHELADLATRVERLFEGPQDVEWALGDDSRVWLLQSRPITAIADVAPAGPVLGPGPVAETFPEPLRRLEVEAWLEPLREGITRALGATGSVSDRRLASSPVALAVDGWPAVDLELLGVHRGRGRVLNPVAGMRRLHAAWRVGRLRAALPLLAADLAAQVDDHLADVPPLGNLTDAQLVTLIASARAELACVHGHEILAGMLLAADTCTPAPALALSALARSRASGRDDSATIVTDPIALSLLPPRFGGTVALPETSSVPEDPTWGPCGQLGSRDALRVRARWLQELGARAMGELGERLAAAGRLSRPQLLRDLGLDELRRFVAGDPPPTDLAERARRAAGPPLPSAFRLTPAGAVVAVRREPGCSEGLGAGGGRAVGRVRHRAPGDSSQRGAILVVPTLDPALAVVLPSLAGLVAETGSALSHLAILARELGVATVVGVPDARRRFPAGTRVLVDGRSGEVRHLADEDDKREAT